MIYAHIHPQIVWKFQIFINDFRHLLIRRPYAITEERLQRMEDKIDRMSQAIVAMARMEERMISVFKRLDACDETMKKIDERMDESEKQAIARGQKIAFAECLFWMVLSGAVGLAFIYLR